MAIRSYKGIHPKLAESVYVDEMALVVGDVAIGKDSSLWPFVAARGDVHSIEIGECTNIQDGSVLHVAEDNRFNPGGRKLIIGSHVTVGHNVVLHACTVEDYALVGMGSVILDGAVIGSRAMVAAGSVVSPGKHLESGYLYLGSPTKQVRPLKPQELEYLEYSAEHYVRLKNNHMAGR